MSKTAVEPIPDDILVGFAKRLAALEQSAADTDRQTDEARVSANQTIRKLDKVAEPEDG